MTTRSSRNIRVRRAAVVLAGILAAIGAGIVLARPQPQERREEVPERGESSYTPVHVTESFRSIHERMSREKPEVMRRQRALLEARYDLGSRPAAGVTFSARSKPIQEGVRAKLPRGVRSWEELANLSPDQVRDRDLFPAGFLPLPHINHPEGGMVFPRFHIDQVLRQDRRDLNRFDMEFDIPEHFLPAFPPAMFLTTRPDLGDVSQGHLVTLDNFHDLFDGVLNPKQLDGLRLLVTPFPQQQFNATNDRRSERPSLGVTCLDCHANGHTNAATHLVGDIRPQHFRRRIDTPSLRGVNVQGLFGSQRALRTVEDFTEFEQRAAYFDGDPVAAAKKGVNILERGSQVHDMAEVQELLDFPPAPKLDVFGKLDPSKATPQELRGQEVFFGKGQCSVCHPAPNYTDGTMHDLRVSRFFTPRVINGRVADREGPIKSFPLRGIKDSPPYLHDGRLLTLDDTVEFFNLVLQTRLSAQEKKDLVSFLRAL
ncbi:MAG TPA: cytochrome B6 [Candidatus Polarisedimenticolia bacterium]|nr:cytochrome B6 [Candidatus Polarisedimenticolia bacterium]